MCPHFERASIMLEICSSMYPAGVRPTRSVLVYRYTLYSSSWGHLGAISSHLEVILGPS